MEEVTRRGGTHVAGVGVSGERGMLGFSVSGWGLGFRGRQKWVVGAGGAAGGGGGALIWLALGYQVRCFLGELGSRV